MQPCRSVQTARDAPARAGAATEGGSSNCEKSKTCNGGTVGMDREQRLLTSPSLNWLVVKPSYESKDSWRAGNETGGVVPLKINDTEFMDHNVFTWSRALEGLWSHEQESASCHSLVWPRPQYP